MFRKVFLLGLLTAFSIYIFNILVDLDMNKKVFNHRPGPCRKLKGIEVGAEDIDLVEEKGLAFISSGLFAHKERTPPAEGNIFLFDFNQTDREPIKLNIVGMVDRKLFRPHGLSHWYNGGKIRLFTICHRPPNNENAIEVFDFDEEKKQLIHVKTIQDEKLERPNDLLAVGEDKVIFTNDGHFNNKLLQILEIFLYYKGGSLVYYDGKETNWLAKGLFSPNGIAYDRKGKLLIGYALGRQLGVYELSEDFKKITEISKIHVGTGIDNFYVDKDNGIWTGAHPIMYQLVPHLQNPDDMGTFAPSQVLRMKHSTDYKSLETTEVFADDGRFFTASSVGIHFNGKLLIGSIFRHTLLCDIVNHKAF